MPVEGTGLSDTSIGDWTLRGKELVPVEGTGLKGKNVNGNLRAQFERVIEG
jgi:hypothetical protein